MAKEVLIIYYSREGNTKLLAQRIMDIFRSLFPRDTIIEMVSIEDLDLERVFKAAGLIIGTPDYFGYPAGKIKTLFDDVYDRRSELKGKPAFGFITHGGTGKSAKPLAELISAVKLKVVGPVITTQDDKISSKLENQIQKNCQALIKLI